MINVEFPGLLPIILGGIFLVAVGYVLGTLGSREPELNDGEYRVRRCCKCGNEICCGNRDCYAAETLRRVLHEVEYKKGGPERDECASIPYVYRIVKEFFGESVEPIKYDQNRRV